MYIIKHRINTIAELKMTLPENGAEIDLRSENGNLILHHDPCKTGEMFSDWLTEYHHGTLILNVKEEGLEPLIYPLLNKYGIEDYFFLDQSTPFLLKTALAGDRRCAVRLSEYESIETVKHISPFVDWVWIDCFTRYPLDLNTVKTLAEIKIKTCLVSPELQGRFDIREIEEARLSFAKLGFEPTAVCTKRPELWG